MVQRRVPSRPAPDRRPWPTRPPVVWSTLVLLIAVIAVFAGIRFARDPADVLAGTVPDDPFAARYVEHWLPAYLHIVPGLVYLVGAPFQLSRRFREADIARHRRLGRVLLPAGLLSGVFALVFGLPHAFGGASEAIATAVFGTWFLVALLLAYRAIRAGDVDRHRRFMIRAFAMGLGVGTIRLWIGLFQGLQLLDLAGGLAVGFWLAFVMHAVAGELYLRARPTADG